MSGLDSFAPRSRDCPRTYLESPSTVNEPVRLGARAVDVIFEAPGTPAADGRLLNPASNGATTISRTTAITGDRLVDRFQALPWRDPGVGRDAAGRRAPV